MSDDNAKAADPIRIHPSMQDVFMRAMTGQRPLRPVTQEQLKVIVPKLVEMESALDAMVEAMYLSSDYTLDAGQLMGAARLIADVRKDLEGEIIKPAAAPEPTPDHCPSCGNHLILVNENDPTGPAMCPNCNFKAPAYPPATG